MKKVRVVFYAKALAIVATIFTQFHAGATSIEECEGQKNAQKRALCFEKLARQQAADSKDNELQSFIKAAKRELTKEFLDPDSANFRDTFVTSSNGSQTLCGEVNAKNKVGGYVGYKAFIVPYDKKQAEFTSILLKNYDQQSREGELKSELFDISWEVSCKLSPKIWQQQ